ncbi:MAG: hypothetical protein H0X51_04900 [Parachlamydiaceae bacterium]|nr:hypothetical protein [Parachlamydiaceae bacterium]
MLFDSINILDKNEISLPIRVLNGIGKFFLSPGHFLFNGRTVNCQHVQNLGLGNRSSGFIFTDYEVSSKNGSVKWLKIIAAIFAFVPGLFIGGIVKGIALVCSKDLKERYVTLASETQFTINGKELRIHLYNKNAHALAQFLRKLHADERQSMFQMVAYSTASIDNGGDENAIRAAVIRSNKLQQLFEGSVKEEAFFEELDTELQTPVDNQQAKEINPEEDYDRRVSNRDSSEMWE